MKSIIVMSLMAQFVYAVKNLNNENKLNVVEISTQEYSCNEKKNLKVKYYELSDHSLGFIKITLPNGEVSTLPQAVSASGARYSDSLTYEWWTKAQEGTLSFLNSGKKLKKSQLSCKEKKAEVASQVIKPNLKGHSVNELINKTFELVSNIPNPNPEAGLNGFVTFKENGKADILPGGDIVLTANYTVSKAGVISVKADLGSYKQQFKIIDEKSISDEYGTVWILKK